ncbi:MAG: hypothetical protein JST36_10065 [Bacteroidetes bacterium]|nr:hypothetical protein [Bacteroidota bacterium]
MRKHVLFILFLIGLSLSSGWLMSRMSWIGRLGVNWFHQDLKFLKTWYWGGGLEFILLFVLFVLQYSLRRKCLPLVGISVQLVALLLAVLGFWLCWVDFKSDLSHHLMKQNFHAGVYLFWIGWACVSSYVSLQVTSKNSKGNSPVKA